jgi:hypothetical protein
LQPFVILRGLSDELIDEALILDIEYEGENPTTPDDPSDFAQPI